VYLGSAFGKGLALRTATISNAVRTRHLLAFLHRQASGLQARPSLAMARPRFRKRHCRSQCRSRRERSQRHCTWSSGWPSEGCQFPRHSQREVVRCTLSCCILTTRRVVLDCSKHLSPSRAKPSPLGPIDHTSRIAAIRRIPKAIERLRTCANNSVMDDMLQRADFRSPSDRAASATGSERAPRPTGVSASA